MRILGARFSRRSYGCALVLLAAGAAALGEEPPSRPKYGPAAVRLFHQRAYVREHDAPDFWALAPYYVSQPDVRSCSSASVAMLLNALRAGRELRAEDELATPAAAPELVDRRLWKDKLRPGGEGVTLDELAEIVRRVLPAYGLTPAKVEAIRFSNDAASAKRLRELLRQNERSAHDLMLANFLQSAATGDPEGAVGHFAPVGAYDARRRCVLLFDPDRRWYEPYWISEETLLQAITTVDPATGRARGLLYVSVSEARPAPARSDASSP